MVEDQEAVSTGDADQSEDPIQSVRIDLLVVQGEDHLKAKDQV